MKFHRFLKKSRIFLSLLTFLLISLIFLDFSGWFPPSYLKAIAFLQFGPSVVRLVHIVAWSSAGFVISLVLTLLFGRIYCSFLCPLGTLQDIFIRLFARFRRKKPTFKFKPPSNWLRYGFLILAILSVGSGFILIFNILDPFSTFGKIVHNLFRPAYLGINNGATRILESINLFWLQTFKWVGINWLALGFALGWTTLLAILSWRRGRLYCNTVCPVGTLLGILSKVSLFRIRIDKTVCNLCGKCSAVCKAECIDVKSREIDMSRCVGCMNCLQPCPEQGVNYTFARRYPAMGNSATDPSRRRFLKGTTLALAGVAGLGTRAMAGQEEKKEVYPGTVPVFREHPVTPPGSKERQRFNEICTACHLCVSACPTQVLQPSYFTYGLKGILQPRMDYLVSFCNFECTACGEVCPTGAILPLPLEEKKLLQLGKVHFVKENCIVQTRNTDCGACSEHCPTKAVRMVPFKGRLTIPEVNDKICIGCGACEYACPTDPKSIYVDGNPIHVFAEKPPEEEALKKVDLKEEFPF